MRKSTVTLVSALIAAALCGAHALADPTELLSVNGLHLDGAHHLTEVKINTWGVTVLAVCHIPPVSVVSVDFDIDPGGTLTWKANSWHGELDDTQLRQLTSLFLVRVSEYQSEPRGTRNEYHPASFEGSATIATIREPTHSRAIKLRADNFGLTPAKRCPDPEPEKTF